MMEDSKKILWYRDLIFYLGLLTFLGTIIVLYSFIGRSLSMNFIIMLTVFTTLLGILTYSMWDTRCPKCKEYFAKKEDKSKEKDLGIREIKREFETKIFKKKDGTIIKKEKESKFWPAKFVQRFYYCKKCGYGKNNEWPKSLEGGFKNWEKEEEWKKFLEKNKPQIIYLKENQEGKYVKISKYNETNKKEKKGNELISIVNFLESKSYSEVRDEEEFEKIVVSLLKNNNHKVLRQKSKGRFRPDILVDDKYPIELKLIENNTGPLQRLSGQIDDYKKIHDEVGVFILVSETSRLLEYVSNKVKEFNKRPGIFAVSKISEIRRKNKQEK